MTSKKTNQNKPGSVERSADEIGGLKERLEKESLEKTADSGLFKSDQEKIVEPETGSDITLPFQQHVNPSQPTGEEIGKGVAAGLLAAGFGGSNGNQNGLQTYGSVTGEATMIKTFDVVGYFPAKGGQGNYQGGWFKVSEDDECSMAMTVKAVSQEDVHYDNGQGYLYHDLKFVVMERFSVRNGRQVRHAVAAARELAKQRIQERNRKMNPSSLVGV